MTKADPALASLANTAGITITSEPVIPFLRRERQGSQLLQPAGWVSDTLVEGVFLGRNAKLFADFVLGLQLKDKLVAYPGRRVRFRIRKGHRDFQRIAVDAPVAFLQAHFVAMGVAEMV